MGIPDQVEIRWWYRLVAAFLATCLTLGLVTILTTLRVAKSLGDYHWGNGGVEQIVGWTLTFGSVIAAGFFVAVIAPLVLIIPPAYQRKYWWIVLSFSAMVGPIVTGLYPSRSVHQLWADVQNTPGLFASVSLVGLCCSTVYLSAIFWIIPALRALRAERTP